MLVRRRAWVAALVAAAVAAAGCSDSPPDRQGSSTPTTPSPTTPSTTSYESRLTFRAGPVPVPAPGPRPDQFLGVTSGGVMVMVDAASGTPLRELSWAHRVPHPQP